MIKHLGSRIVLGIVVYTLFAFKNMFVGADDSTEKPKTPDIEKVQIKKESDKQLACDAPTHEFETRQDKVVKEEKKAIAVTDYKKFNEDLKKGVERINAVIKDSYSDDYTYIVYANGEVIGNKGINANDIIPIGSLSTQFTSYILLDAIAKKYGKDKLKDIIHKPIGHISEIKDLCDSINRIAKCDWLYNISIHQLLSHTSGVPGYEDIKDIIGIAIFKNSFFVPSLEKIIASIPYNSAYMKIGAFQYSMFNYLIVSMIAEKITGKTFDALVADLAKEVGLESLMNISGPSLNKWIKSHSSDKCYYTPKAIDNVPFCIIQGCSSIMMNVNDMCVWYKYLFNSDIYKFIASCNYSSEFGLIHSYGFVFDKLIKAISQRGTFGRYCGTRICQLRLTALDGNFVCIMCDCKEYKLSNEYILCVGEFVNRMLKERCL